jgi:hypothetical protein
MVMNKLIIAMPLVLGLAGCANGVNAIATDINTLTGALSSPAATQAAANLKAGAQAVLCDISSAANVGVQLAQAVSAKQAIIKDAQTVYVVSSTLCAALGGNTIGTAVVPTSVSP